LSHVGAGPERLLAAMAGELLLMGRDGVVLRVDSKDGARDGRRYYIVTARRHAPAYAEELRRRGIAIRTRSGEGDAARFLVELTESQTPDALVDAAVTLDVPLVEMVPLLEPPYGAGTVR
jgi:hypothetical protein